MIASTPSTTKKALLVGLNYTGTESQLSGCVNDVKAMADLLVQKFGYNRANVTVLTDTDLQGEISVLAYLEELVSSAQANDHLYFHYSGHGTQVVDTNNDELDGFDEALYTRKGVVTDDQIAAVLVKLNSAVTMTLVFDCCHSATICDLPYHYMNEGQFRTESQINFPGKIVMLSGCKDPQTSADAWDASRRDFYGALTSKVIDILNGIDHRMLKWREFLDILQENLRIEGYTQIPQLSTNQTELLENLITF